MCVLNREVRQQVWHFLKRGKVIPVFLNTFTTVHKYKNEEMANRMWDDRIFICPAHAHWAHRHHHTLRTAMQHVRAVSMKNDARQAATLYGVYSHDNSAEKCLCNYAEIWLRWCIILVYLRCVKPCKISHIGLCTFVSDDPLLVDTRLILSLIHIWRCRRRG